jgi:hypothetical protein
MAVRRPLVLDSGLVREFPTGDLMLGTILPLVAYPAVTLTDAATIATNAALGSYFRVTLGGNRTLGDPTNPTDTQPVIWEFAQDGTGSRTLTLSSAFVFGADLTVVTLTTTASKRDLMGAIYHGPTSKWLVTFFLKGFA